MELVVVMEVAVAEVEAETCPLLMLSVMAEASTASVGGAGCVGGSRPTEVMQLPMLPEHAVAEMATETRRLPPMVLSVSVERDRRRWLTVVTELLDLTVADVEAAMRRLPPLLLPVLVEADERRCRRWWSCRS